MSRDLGHNQGTWNDPAARVWPLIPPHTVEQSSANVDFSRDSYWTGLYDTVLLGSHSSYNWIPHCLGLPPFSTVVFTGSGTSDLSGQDRKKKIWNFSCHLGLWMYKPRKSEHAQVPKLLGLPCRGSSLDLEILELLAPCYSSNNHVWVSTGQLHPAQQRADTASVSDLGAVCFQLLGHTAQMHSYLSSNARPYSGKKQQRFPLFPISRVRNSLVDLYFIPYNRLAKQTAPPSTAAPICSRAGVNFYSRARQSDKTAFGRMPSHFSQSHVKQLTWKGRF